MNKEVLWVFCLLGLTACNGLEYGLNPGSLLGGDAIAGPAAVIPGRGGVSRGSGRDFPVLGESCHSDDSSQFCLALKYVVFEDSEGKSIINEQQALKNVQGINRVWSKCNIGFQVEAYDSVDPSSSGIRYQIANFSELDQIRNTYSDDRTLLVTSTGAWNRSGSLGSSSANAWTSMPDSSPFGVVLEKSVASFSNIIAHELGHYLNLGHLNDKADLMNPIIYDSSTVLYEDQCKEARASIGYFWKKMLR